MARIDKDHIDKFFDYGLDIASRTIYLGSAEYTEDDDETGVDFYMAERFIKAIHLLDKSAPSGDKPITVIMNNPGGDMVHGMAIYDAIKLCKNHITIKVFGNVCSMGGYILQAADERLLAPNSVFMFHMGYENYNSNHPKIIYKWVEFYKNKYNKTLDLILLNAINNKRIKDNKKTMTMNEFEKHNDFDTILTAEEAIEWGFADKIIDDND